MLQRRRFIVQGQVQGVGFRPFVFSLAEELSLTGMTRNSPRGVVIEVQGREEDAQAFAQALQKRLPPLARVTSLAVEECETIPGEESFVIAASTAGDSHAVLISPDMATCPDCLADIAEPGNRRYGYAFVNCTNCGPRYSITRSIPYDRASTSMACFPMCPDCLAEYENPRDRRFHAQPNACPVCGPGLVLTRGGGEKKAVACDFRPERAQNKSRAGREPAGAGPGGLTAEREAGIGGRLALPLLAKELLEGKTAAIKGLGGFHLACDACNEKSVSLLRERKRRPHKPFAVMAADIEEVARFAHVGEREAALLASRERPIVVCRLKAGALAPSVSPDTSSVGVMLPYTPLHSLLFESLRAQAGASRPLVLVMTSGNPGGEPICLGNREALAKLEGMADLFLLHNRDILIRVDDSVLRVTPGGGSLYYRRARGYTPAPAPLPDWSLLHASSSRERAGEEAPCVLGVGPELKNTLCFSKGNDAFVSQHIGDMGNLETAAFHREMRDHLAALLKVSPSLVVRDLHPNYLSSGMAEEFAKERRVPVLALQHHFAHAHAVLAEHAFAGKALALALDGTGLGEDGALWGGEILFVDCSPATVKRLGRPLHERLAAFAPLPLPGAEAAIREPWRIAHALLLQLGLGKERIERSLQGVGANEAKGELSSGALPWLPEHAATARLLPAMLERRINSPLSTSCGRLFDAVSALLGLCNATSYEGQAAVRLEEAQALTAKDWEALGAEDLSAWLDRHALYPCPAKKALGSDPGHTVLDVHALFAAVYADRAGGTPVSLVSRRFHASLAAGLADLVGRLAEERGLKHAGLSGGCLQNMTLAVLLEKELKKKGLTPLLHKALPPGDACVSLGQAAWGRYVLAGGKPLC